LLTLGVNGVEAPYIIALFFVHIAASADSLMSLWRYDNALNDDASCRGSPFPPPPPKMGYQIPSIFCTGYPRDDLQNPENRVKMSRPV